MKFISAKKDDTTTFGDLKYGDVFLYNGYLYMKIKDYGNFNNYSIRLRDGDMYHFVDNFETVVKVDAEIHYTY